ncbi:endo alpha-1,4 polygalactosaminidase [Paenibacillus chartarius]|uniref:Endo alpha-1,4 polygalactosaminidase n=1 Tax=Paenibacillus chartarius TaxID=747481 RepID=A0ABV6DRB1_9BACL
MNGRARMKEASTFALYYGVGRVEELSRFDLAIVEPAGQSENEIRELKRSGTLPAAYVSVMEIADYDPMFRLLNDEDFLSDSGGQRVCNEQFGTYMLDLTSPRWQGLLFHRIGSLLVKSGYEGIFLDTIGNVELHRLPAERQLEQLHAAAHMVRQLRERFPEAVLIQNNGLHQLGEMTCRWLDGICWENPNFVAADSMEWSMDTLERLTAFAEGSGVRVLLLIELYGNEDSVRNETTVRKAAESRNFMVYGAPPQYVSDVYGLDKG